MRRKFLACLTAPRNLNSSVMIFTRQLADLVEVGLVREETGIGTAHVEIYA